MTIKELIEGIESNESYRDTCPMISRMSGNRWSVSTIGYSHQDHADICEQFIKSGLFKYDVQSGPSGFDKMSGRYFTAFKLKE